MAVHGVATASAVEVVNNGLESVQKEMCLTGCSNLTKTMLFSAYVIAIFK